MCARISAFLVAIAVAAAGVAIAQETTGTIAGRVVDAQGLAVPGVTVTVTGPQAPRTVVTDGAGRFSVPFLVPGTYAVRAELQGFRTLEQRDVNLSLGQTISLTFEMQVGGLAEVVNVEGASPLIDTQSTTTGAVLSSELLARIPVGRRVTDALYVAPGVSSGGSVGRANPSFAGGSGLDNLYVIDGVNVSNAGYGGIGSYSIVFGSLGTATPFDFAQEIQVKTGGYEAQFGQSMGGVVNIVTKSGTNRIRGSVFGYTRADALEAGWRTVQTANGTVNTVGSQTHDAGIEGGFPVVRNRLFVFGAINPAWETRTFVAPDGFPLQSLGNVDRERRLFSYSAKGTYQIAPAHRIDASFFGDPSVGRNGPQRTNALLRTNTSGFSEIDYGGHNQTLRYDGVFGSNWLVETSFARAKNIIEERPSMDEWNVRDTRVVPNIITGGIGFYEAGNDGENRQYTIKSTHVLAGHQVKYGFLYEDLTYSQIQMRTGPPITGPDGRQTASGASVTILPDAAFGQIYRVTRALYNSERNTRQDYYSFFVQDSWNATDRLTINAGIRYDQQRLIGGFSQLPLIDGGFVDSFSLKNNWAPRIGVVYDVLGNGRSRLYGNYGRFFARLPNDLAARVLSADEAITRGDYFDAGLTQPVPNGVLAAGVTQHFIAPGRSDIASDQIDPDSKLSYKDEFVLGFEYEAFGNTSLGIRYMHRNIGRAIEDIAPYPMVSCELGVEGACNFDTYILTNPSAQNSNRLLRLLAPELQGQGISFEDPVHKYNAVELTMNRRFSDNWSLMSSYRWSRLHGTFEGFFREDNGQSDPGLTSLYDFPTADPTYVALGTPFGYSGDIRYLGEAGKGPLPLDRPHQLKVFGNYAFDMGVSVGVGFTGTSGKPLTAFAANPMYQNGGEIPLTPRGAGFETVDGFRTRTPAEWTVDVQASYVVNLAGTRRVTLIADAFNLFDIRRPIDYNSYADIGFGTPNPDFGTISSGNLAGQMYQPPFALRLGARFEF